MRQGVRCGKMAVVCRNIPDYRAAIRYEFRMADIPLYCDEPTTPEFSAPATAVRALLALLRGADMTENLTILAKTGLCALTEPQVCALENYAYTWSPNAAAWRTKFEKSPKGFGENELSDEDAKTLEDAETARQLLVTAVDELRSKVRGGSAEQISRELYFCLKKLGAEEQQAALVEAVRTARGIPAAEEAAREWNVVMQLLNEMAHLLGGQGVTFAEYEDLFSLLLRSSDLGHIPQTLDAVVLAVVSREEEGTYGYKITQEIKQALELSESTLYPVLRRLQKDGCLTIYDEPFNGRNRRYYKITPLGRQQLAGYKAEWKVYAANIDHIFGEDAK